jgi:hypothetical protein
MGCVSFPGVSPRPSGSGQDPEALPVVDINPEPIGTGPRVLAGRPVGWKRSPEEGGRVVGWKRQDTETDAGDEDDGEMSIAGPGRPHGWKRDDASAEGGRFPPGWKRDGASVEGGGRGPPGWKREEDGGRVVGWKREQDGGRVVGWKREEDGGRVVGWKREKRGTTARVGMHGNLGTFGKREESDE